MAQQAGNPNVRGMRLFLLAFVASLAFVFALSLSGCSNPPGSDSKTGDQIGQEQPPKLPPPDNTDLSTPEAAVRTYLDWISYAYRIVNSQVAFDYMTSWEFVRVDAYIEKNRQENKAIDQQIVKFSINEVSGSESTKTVETSEEWKYRYFRPGGTYISEELTATYAVRYTVVRAEDRDAWLVDKVEPVPQGKVE